MDSDLQQQLLALELDILSLETDLRLELAQTAPLPSRYPAEMLSKLRLTNFQIAPPFDVLVRAADEPISVH